MKQRHSYADLLYHLVPRTKNREPFIGGEEEEHTLHALLRKKAHDLDAWIEEVGGWKEHIHLLLRTRPTVALSAVYGRMKGFAAWAWHKRWPDRPFGWNDGVWVKTVDPESCETLRMYIRNQREHQAQNTERPRWEAQDSASL